MALLYKGAPPDPSQSIQVIGAGLSRTGTTSFTLALEILLKHPVLHSGSACMTREEGFMKSFLSLLRGSTPYSQLSKGDKDAVKSKLRALCAGYVGISDIPGAYMIEELADAFPDAVVIVTTRDPDNWWKSMEPLGRTIMKMTRLNILFLPLPAMRHFSTLTDLVSRRSQMIHGTGQGMSGPGDLNGPGFMAHHHAYVERSVQSVRPMGSAKVFYFGVKDGWEPLCKILGLPVPDVPFPHANDADAVQEMMHDFIRRGLMRWSMAVAVFTVAGYSLMKMSPW